MLSPAALPNTIRARVASACAMLWLHNHASNWARSASLTSTTHLLTPMQHRQKVPYTLFSDTTLGRAPQVNPSRIFGYTSNRQARVRRFGGFVSLLLVGVLYLPDREPYEEQP